MDLSLQRGDEYCHGEPLTGRSRGKQPGCLERSIGKGCCQLLAEAWWATR